MNQGNYSTASQTLESPVLDLTNWQEPRYSYTQIKSLAGPCYRITVKNAVDGTTSACPISVTCGIVTCTGPAIGTCPTDPTGFTCPADNTISSTTYVNMVATFTLGANQTGVKVTFEYLLNDVPTSTTITYDATAGTQTVYAFGTNQQLNPDVTWTLYGAVVSV